MLVVPLVFPHHSEVLVSLKEVELHRLVHFIGLHSSSLRDLDLLGDLVLVFFDKIVLVLPLAEDLLLGADLGFDGVELLLLDFVLFESEF